MICWVSSSKHALYVRYYFRHCERYKEKCLGDRCYQWNKSLAWELRVTHKKLYINIKQKVAELEIDNSTIIVGAINASFSILERTTS